MAVCGIGVTARDQLLDHGDHLADMFGGARADAGRQAAQRRDVFIVDAGRVFRQVADGDAAFRRPRVDLVIHVGDVADIGDMGVAIFMAQQPEQHIEHDGRAGIADMGEIVNRGAADIHADILRVARDESVLALGQAVVEAQSHDKSPEGDGKVANIGGEQKGFCSVSCKSKSE